MPVHCVVPGCSSTSDKCPSLSFHGIPSTSNGEWRTALLHAICRSDNNFNTDKPKICSRHFEEHCFNHIGNHGRTTLLDGRLPTKFMPEKSNVLPADAPNDQPVTSIIFPKHQKKGLEEESKSETVIPNPMSTPVATQTGVDKSVGSRSSTDLGRNCRRSSNLTSESGVGFDPDRSQREMRKINTRISLKKKKTMIYNEKGIHVETNLDLCDCLEVDCPGCHRKCPKCLSNKCGTECRCNRHWFYEQVEIEGSNRVNNWPGSSSTT